MTLILNIKKVTLTDLHYKINYFIDEKKFNVEKLMNSLSYVSTLCEAIVTFIQDDGHLVTLHSFKHQMNASVTCPTKCVYHVSDNHIALTAII